METGDPLAIVELAKTSAPDAILLDIIFDGAPIGVDGFSVCRNLKDDPATSHLPVIVLSARDAAADFALGRLAGAAHYLAKPFGPIELINAIHAVTQDPSARAGIGLYLIDEGLITHDQLRNAIARQRALQEKGERMRLGEVLITMGYISQDGLARALERQRSHG